MTKGYTRDYRQLNAAHDTYAGEIATLTMQRANIVFRPTDKTGDREPDYRIIQERDGATFEMGVAWKHN